MVFCVTQSANRVTKELDQSVGNLVHLALETMEPSAPSLLLMVEELATLYGIRANAKGVIVKDVKKMAFYGTLNADLALNQLAAAFAHQCVRTAKQTSGPLVLRNLTEEGLESQ